MHYLKAVIKETLRYHPPLPLLVPRVASKDVKIEGYNVSVGTRKVSAREILEFFDRLHFKGMDFEFIPFGAGRRGCPGITCAVVAIEFMLTNLVQKFNWELPDGVEGKDLDMSESPRVTVHRGVPLLAVASQNK